MVQWLAGGNSLKADVPFELVCLQSRVSCSNSTFTHCEAMLLFELLVCFGVMLLVIV